MLLFFLFYGVYRNKVCCVVLYFCGACDPKLTQNFKGAFSVLHARTRVRTQAYRVFLGSALDIAIHNDRKSAQRLVPFVIHTGFFDAQFITEPVNIILCRINK